MTESHLRGFPVGFKGWAFRAEGVWGFRVKGCRARRVTDAVSKSRYNFSVPI